MLTWIKEKFRLELQLLSLLIYINRSTPFLLHSKLPLSWRWPQFPYKIHQNPMFSLLLLRNIQLLYFQLLHMPSFLSSTHQMDFLRLIQYLRQELLLKIYLGILLLFNLHRLQLSLAHKVQVWVKCKKLLSSKQLQYLYKKHQLLHRLKLTWQLRKLHCII